MHVIERTSIDARATGTGAPALGERPVARGPSARRAATALLLATLFWGLGFTWAKRTGAVLNESARVPPGSALGPVLLLAWRYTLGGLIWLAAFPAARRRWSAGSLMRAAVLGVLLYAGLVLQHLGLDRTSEAVSAFLTSLTILFVPLLMTVGLRKPPRGIVWVAVLLATAGIWLMTGATPAGFGIGELLGLGCAVVFSLYMIAVNLIVPRDDPWRMTAGQFLVTGFGCLLTCLLLKGGPAAVASAAIFQPRVIADGALLILFPTLLSFGALNYYQPHLDPTRAALLYLLEPVFAAAFAWVFAGRGLGPVALGGAGLILVANLTAELRIFLERAVLCDGKSNLPEKPGDPLNAGG